MRQEFLGLSKAGGRRPVHRESLLQGRLLLYLAGAQLTVVLEGSNSNQIIEKHRGISLACSVCLFSLLTNIVE